MRLYKMSSHVFLEVFEEDAVLFVADRNEMLSINHAAAELFGMAQNAAGEKTFTRAEFFDFLLDNYQMSKLEAEQRMRAVLGFCLQRGIVQKNTTQFSRS